LAGKVSIFFLRKKHFENMTADRSRAHLALDT